MLAFGRTLIYVVEIEIDQGCFGFSQRVCEFFIVNTRLFLTQMYRLFVVG